MSDDNTKVTDGPQEPAKQDALPDWARKQISEANAEAAKYRNERNTIEADTTAKLKAEFDAQLKTLSDEKSAITAERDTTALSYTKLGVALAAGVPGETAVKFAGLLQGSNEDELKAHAEELKSMFGGPVKIAAIDPSHGAGGGSGAGISPDEAWSALFKSAGIK